MTRSSLVVLPFALLAWGCAASTSKAGLVGPDTSKVTPAKRRADGTVVDDRSMCEWKGRKDREVSETAGPGAVEPNVRRVWQVFGSGADRRTVLICREVDTNLDGIKDTVRRYDDEGLIKEELSDTDYDGKIDTWITFAKGHLAEVKIDHNHDGIPDEWKTYAEGKLIRVKRDTNFDGKPDIWEMYQKGKLVRAGVDVDGDERVDRWDHDTEWRRRLEASDRAKEEEEGKRKARDAKEAAAKALETDDEEEAKPAKKEEPKAAPAKEPKGDAKGAPSTEPKSEPKKEPGAEPKKD